MLCFKKKQQHSQTKGKFMSWNKWEELVKVHLVFKLNLQNKIERNEELWWKYYILVDNSGQFIQLQIFFWFYDQKHIFHVFITSFSWFDMKVYRFWFGEFNGNSNLMYTVNKWALSDGRQNGNLSAIRWLNLRFWFEKQKKKAHLNRQMRDNYNRV